MKITRREALMASAGLAASARAARRNVRFGIRTPFPASMGLRDRAMLAKRLGYEGIELGPEWLKEPADAIRKELAGSGIAVSAMVGSIGLLDPDAAKRAAAVELDRKRLVMAKELGADCLIEVPVFGPNRFPSRAVEDQLLIAGLKELAADVQRSGVTLLLEPLTRKETHFMNLQSHGVKVIKAVGAPSGFKLLSDFYHMQMEEPDIAATLSTTGEFTGYVHLADGEKRTEPGSLPFDYRPGFRALKKWGYSGWLTMECKATDTPEAALARGLKYIQSQWAEA
jgi:sugar phosphate isomerase/epimerase